MNLLDKINKISEKLSEEINKEFVVKTQENRGYMVFPEGKFKQPICELGMSNGEVHLIYFSNEYKNILTKIANEESLPYKKAKFSMDIYL